MTLYNAYAGAWQLGYLKLKTVVFLLLAVKCHTLTSDMISVTFT